MRIKYLGHACFLITGDEGTRILIDPYQSGGYDGAIGYEPIRDEADLVVVTHGHSDHSAVEEVPGHPLMIRQSSMARGIRFEAVEAFHDAEKGAKRGKVLLFAFELDGIRIVHLSDLGDRLDPEQIERLGRIDVLLVPVGGIYTLDGEGAAQVVEDLKPSLAIPMHFKTDKIGFPLDGVEEFMARFPSARRPGRCQLELSRGSLPRETEVVVLEPIN